MQLHKLSEDHYVVVDDSQITEDSYALHLGPLGEKEIVMANGECKLDKKIVASTQPIYKNDFWAIRKLDLSYIHSLIGNVDVEKKADEFADSEYVNNNYKLSEAYPSVITECYIQGYNQCLDDNKDKQYTKTEVQQLMRLAFEQGFKKADVVEAGLESKETDIECDWILNKFNPTLKSNPKVFTIEQAKEIIKKVKGCAHIKPYDFEDCKITFVNSDDEILSSVMQQTKDSWDVEFIDGQLKLKK